MLLNSSLVGTKYCEIKNKRCIVLMNSRLGGIKHMEIKNKREKDAQC